MKRPVAIIAAVLLGAAGWLFFQFYELQGWQAVKLSPRSGRVTATPAATPAQLSGWQLATAGSQVATAGSKGTVRLAAWDLDSLSVQAGYDAQMQRYFVQTVQQFDAIAVQGLQRVASGVLQQLMDAASTDQRRYVYLASPEEGSSLGFIYNSQTLVLDPASMSPVLDPDQLVQQDPLVAWFRVRGVDPRRAFTFTMVNFLVHPQRQDIERAVVEQTFFQVRADGREEDDVILCGNLRADHRQLTQQFHSPRLTCLLVDTPTDVQLQSQTVNLVVDREATLEFTGRSGTFDFLREFNLSLDEAQRISPYLPVWAEFTREESYRTAQSTPETGR